MVLQFSSQNGQLIHVQVSVIALRLYKSFWTIVLLCRADLLYYRTIIIYIKEPFFSLYEKIHYII